MAKNALLPGKLVEILHQLIEIILKASKGACIGLDLLVGCKFVQILEY